MELLDKLKLNSPVVKIGDDYNATFPNKSGTIALTSDIPDTYTKEETDGKYVKFGENNGIDEDNARLFICLGVSNPYISVSCGVECSYNYTKISGNEIETNGVISTSSIKAYSSDGYSCALQLFANEFNIGPGIADFSSIGACFKVGTSFNKGISVDEELFLGGACSSVSLNNKEIYDESGLFDYASLSIKENDNEITLPINRSGEIALTSDIPDNTDFVDLASEQYICGVKKFTNGIKFLCSDSSETENFSISRNGISFESAATGVVLPYFSSSGMYHETVAFSNLVHKYGRNEWTITGPYKSGQLALIEDITSATQHLKTKSYQSVETTGDKWTITLDSEYSSAPFFQVFNSENSVVYPEVKFTAPSTLELTFEGKEGIGLGEFTAVVSVPFTTTITPNESYVSIGTAQGINGKKNFTTVPTINSVDIATVDNLSTVENSVRSYVDTEISAKVASVYRFKGDSAYASLPANAQVGDVYNLTTASGEYKIGDNVAWTGSKWDKLAATIDLSGYLTTSSASSTYLTISSANSTYATIGDTLRTSCAGTQYMSGTLCLNNPYACLSAPSLFASDGISVGIPDSENDTSYFYGPVEFNDTVTVSELEIDSLSLETLEIGNEINVNGIAVSESISKLNAKTGSLEHVLPAKAASNGVVEWEVTINTDLTKTVKCPPNVIVCDITGERYKYVVCDIEWDGANKIYIKFDNDDSIEDNQFKAYITNIQLQ